MGDGDYFSGLIRGLGEQMGAKELKPGDDRSCTLIFDDLPVSLQYLETDGEILLYCVVGSIPEEEAARARLYGRLLEANYFFRGTGGGVLAADAASGLLGFFRREPAAALDNPGFLRLLEQYLNRAGYWRGECASLAQPPAAEAPAAPPGPARAGWIRT
jgi:hypothetical protein